MYTVITYPQPLSEQMFPICKHRVILLDEKVGHGRYDLMFQALLSLSELNLYSNFLKIEKGWFKQ